MKDDQGAPYYIHNNSNICHLGVLQLRTYPTISNSGLLKRYVFFMPHLVKYYSYSSRLLSVTDCQKLRAIS